MSETATLTFGANISGNNVQSGFLGPTTVVLPNSPNEHYVTTTASGLTLLLVPQLPVPAQYCRIVPPTSSSVNKWIMSAAGDTVGFQISSTLETWVSISVAMTSFNLRASGTENIDVYWY